MNRPVLKHWAAVAFRLAHEGRARLDAEGLELVLEGVRDELAAMVVAELRALRDLVLVPPLREVDRLAQALDGLFTNWMCGGGIKGGVTHGESDNWGYKPLDRKNPTTVYDIHATMLRLLGIDHTKLTWRHNGSDRRLTDVHGHVIEPIIA